MAAQPGRELRGRERHPVPEGGLFIPTGIANPVLIAVGITLLIAFSPRDGGSAATSTRSAATQRRQCSAGINTRSDDHEDVHRHGRARGGRRGRISARLNAATIALGTGVELQVIAAAVIGGTSFAGGIGTIAGGVLGAVVMQSLSSGMILIGVDTAMQDIVVGVVLVGAVGVDTILGGAHARQERS